MAPIRGLEGPTVSIVATGSGPHTASVGGSSPDAYVRQTMGIGAAPTVVVSARVASSG